MAKEEKVSAQPPWDFPPRPGAPSEVIQLPDRQPSYPRDAQRDDLPRRER